GEECDARTRVQVDFGIAGVERDPRPGRPGCIRAVLARVRNERREEERRVQIVDLAIGRRKLEFSRAVGGAAVDRMIAFVADWCQGKVRAPELPVEVECE